MMITGIWIHFTKAFHKDPFIWPHNSFAQEVFNIPFLQAWKLNLSEIK